MATSGTVSTYQFSMRKVIDHAARRAGRQPQNLSAEQLEVAKDLIFTITSQWINAQFPLWTRQFVLLNSSIGSPDAICPPGVLDVFHTFWRALNPYRGPAMTTQGGDASLLFGGQPNADVIIGGTNPGVKVGFNGAAEVDTIGILLGGVSSITAAVVVSTSTDGVTYSPAQTLPSATYAPGIWQYFDLNPSLMTPYLQIAFPGSTPISFNQFNIGFANSQEYEIGALNIDDYWSLPNKQFQANAPNCVYIDRQLNQVVLKAWPVINTIGFYNGVLTALVRRYIQDPGSLTNAVEVPQRWLEALIWRLANLLIYELPDDVSASANGSPYGVIAKQQLITNIGIEASKAEALAWSEERTRAAIRWAPDIGCYTK